MTADRIAELEAEVARLTAECEASMQTIASERERAEQAERNPMVAVRQLQWGYHGDNRGDKRGFWRGQTSFDWAYRIYVRGTTYGLDGVEFDTFEDAAAFAQADYEQRVRSALAQPESPDP